MAQQTPAGATDADLVIVEQALWLSLAELSTASGCEAGFIEELVDEGALAPVGAAPGAWRFEGAALARTRVAVRLVRDLQLNAPGVALALELLDEIAALRARLMRAG